MHPVTTLSLATLVLTTAACARSLTENETTFAKTLFGDTLDTDEVQIVAGVGLTPLPLRPKPDPEQAAAPPRKPPDDLCVRKPNPRKQWRWPAAFVLDDTIYFSYKWYPFDAFEGMPDSVPFPHSVLMAHELAHVWQWQNRDRTNYSPFAAGNESLESKDPYFFETKAGAEFLTYGYEQQAAMIEDFVCYAFFDPEDAKLDEIAAILRPFLPVDGFMTQLGR